MYSAYEKLYSDKYKNDSKGAWNEVAENNGLKSGDAVRIACENYRKKLKKST